MDISSTLEPNSDQLDAVELLGGARTFTIASVSRGNAEQPVQVHFADFPRPWRPGKSMRRVLAACWGTDASVWVGRRVTLYCDESIRFGAEVVGGTRIKSLSHIDRARSVSLLVSRGKSARYTVEPLTDSEPGDNGPSQKAAEAIAHFQDTWHVTVDQLEARVGRTKDSWTAQDLASLRTLSSELKRGQKTVADEFRSEPPEPAADSAAEPTAEDIAAMNAEAATAEAERTESLFGSEPS